MPTTVILEDFESATAVIPRTGGFIRSTTSPYSGAYSFKSNINGVSNGVDTATFNILVPDGSVNAALEYYARVSSESNYDWLTITLNGTQLTRISGTVGWTRYTATLNVGNNTLIVKYTKDVSVNSGEDAGYIDNIKVTYDPPANIPGYVEGWLWKGPDLLPNLQFALHNMAPTPTWYDFFTDEEGYFMGQLPTDSYIIEGIYIPASNEWFPIALQFDVVGPDMTGLGYIQLRPDLVQSFPEMRLGLSDAITSRIFALTKGWDFDKFGAAWFDVVKKFYSADDTLALSDGWNAKLKDVNGDTITLAEATAVVLKKLMDDPAATADGIAAKYKDVTDDPAALSDALAALFKDAAGDDTYSITDSLTPALTARTSADDALSLTDSVQSKAALQLSETIGILDTIAASMQAVFDDVLALDDSSITPRLIVQFQDTINLADGILNLFKAVQGDVLGLSDSLGLNYKPTAFDDQYAATDAATTAATARPSLNDVATLADSTAAAIKSFQADILALADALSLAAKATQGDTLALLDDVSKKLATGTIDEAMAAVDDLAKKITTLAYDLETIAANNFTDLLNLNKYTGTGTISTVQDDSAQDGYVLRANGYWWGAPQNALIPFEPNTLYEIRARVRQVSPPTSGTSTCYIGVEALAADGTTFINAGGANSRSSQHYIAAAGVTLSSQWTEYVGYFRGTSGSVGAVRSDPNNPAALYPGSAYFRPMFILNYSGGDGVADIDYQIIRKSVGVSDNITALAKLGIDDPATIAEVIVNKVASAQADLLSLLDAAQAKAQDVNDDTTAPTDALAIVTKRLLADTLALTDDIYRAYKTGVITAGTFDFGRFDNSVYDDTGDLITAADTIDIKQGFGALGADLLALADALKFTYKDVQDDAVSLVDALALKIKDSGNDDAIALADALAAVLNNRNNYDEAIGLAEALALTMKDTGNDDAINLADAIVNALTARGSYDEAIGLADQDAAKSIEPGAGDASSLDEQLAFTFKKGVDEIISLADDLIRKLAAVLGDEPIGAADNLTLAAKAVAAEVVLSLAEGNQFKAMASLADLMTLSDAQLAKVAAAIYDTTYTSDLLRSKVGAVLADTAGLSDALNLAVIMGVIDEAATVTDLLTNILRLTLGAAFDNAVFDDSAFDASGDQLGIVESLALLIRTALADSLNLADDSRALAKSQLVDSLNLLDNLAGLYSIAVASPGITLADSIGFKAAISLADTLTLADVLANKWTTGTDDGLAPSDYLILKAAAAQNDALAIPQDALTVTAKAQQDDQALILADDIVRNMKAVLADTLTLADAIAPKYGTTLPEALDIAEDIVFKIRVAWDDTLVLSDTLTTAEGYTFTFQEVVDLMDDNFIKTSRQLADTLALVDALQTKAQLTQDEAVAAADILGVLTKRSAADSIALLDDISRLYRYILGVAWDMATWDIGQFDKQGDFIAVGDDYRFAAAAMLRDAIAADEALAAKAGIQLGDDSTSLADQIINAINSAAADTLGISDQLLQLLMKMKSDDLALSLADLLASRAAMPPDDSSMVADNLIASLRMARSADDLLATAEAILAKVKATLQDIVALTDSAAFNAKKAIDEAITVAEALGLKTGRPLPGDAVGIIDELYLKYALGIMNDDLGEFADSIRGKVKTLLQQVFINGTSIPVNGLNIRGSGTDRVGTATFRIPSPSAEVLALAKQRAPVNIYLVDGVGNTDYFGGRIVGNPTAAKGSISTEMEITVDDWTAAAMDVFVIESFPEGWGTISEALRYLWRKYYGYEIDLAGIVDTEKAMPSQVFNYVTLFEVTERMAQLLGWSWHVDWNGAGRVLNFYPPSAAILPITLSREARNIAAGTARFGQDETIANVVYVFGGNGISQPYTQKIVADGQNTIYKLGSKPHRLDDSDDGAVKITLIQPNGTRVAQKMGIMNLHDENAFDCLLDFNEATLRWRDNNKPKKYPDGTADVIEAVYRYTYPIMVQLTDDNSIRQYGRIEVTVNDSSLIDTAAARDYGRAILRDKAYPKGFGSCEVFVPGLRAGQFVTVNMPAYDTTGLFEITEIEKWIQAGTVRRRVTLNKADNPESRIAERLKDFVKRLASLEASNRPEDVAVQRFMNGPANIGAKVTGRVGGKIQDAVADSIQQPLDDYVAFLKQTGKARGFASDSYNATEAVQITPKKAAAETLAAVERLSGGITFFDIHKFGDASHPFGM